METTSLLQSVFHAEWSQAACSEFVWTVYMTLPNCMSSQTDLQILSHVERTVPQTALIETCVTTFWGDSLRNDFSEKAANSNEIESSTRSGIQRDNSGSQQHHSLCGGHMEYLIHRGESPCSGLLLDMLLSSNLTEI
jgi:hypothetical protein